MEEQVAVRLMEALRSSTGLSHQLSQVGLLALLEVLEEQVPECGSLWNCLHSKVLNYQSIELPEESEDLRKLNEIFRQLWSCKSDEQQRSWPIHEDEMTILGHLENLHVILSEADPRICRDVISREDFESLDLLATYYQMEPRRQLRLSMLKVFIACCELDARVINHLLTTVLPSELARGLPQLTDDVEMFEYCCLVLILLFCTGVQPPQTIYSQFDQRFLEAVYGVMEENEELSDRALAVLLAFNLHFSQKPHPLVELLSSRSEARILTEKLIFLVNRELDPTKLVPHSEVESAPNSVLKLLTELFSSPQTDNLFYLNDIKVLLDIIVRQINDLSPGHQNRVVYLELAFRVMLLPSYEEHQHRLSQIQQIVVQLRTHEDTTAAELGVLNNFCPLLPYFQLP